MPGHNKILQVIGAQLDSSRKIKRVVGDLEGNKLAICGEVNDLAKILLVKLFSSRGKTVFVVPRKVMISRYEDVLEGLGVEYFLVDKDGLPSFLASHESTQIALTSVDQLVDRVIAREDYRDSVINLSTGDKLDPGFVNELTSIGYERVKRVYKDGEWSMTGDAITVGTFSGRFRIDLFGSKIEGIVDLAHKTKVVKIVIPPVVVATGNDFVAKYFDGWTLIFDGNDATESVLSELFHLGEDIKGMAEMARFLNSQKRVYLEDFFVDEKKGVNLSWLSPKKYGKTFAALIGDLRRYQKEDRKIIIFSEHTKKLEKLLSDNGLAHCREDRAPGAGIVLIDGGLPEGVSISDPSIIIFSDNELFGTSKTRKKKKSFSALTNLKVGEYVVHVDHGVGRFTGYGVIRIDDIVREYIFIEYNKGDKIYVPLDQADKVTKYINVGNQSPHLSSLSNNNWVKTRAKVQEHVESIARELLEIQALREDKKLFHYIDDSKEQDRLAKSFAYDETSDQKRAIADVLSDMMKEKPMDRILCGDVGYGKTEVAVRAALRAVLSGGQVAILVPTTILAEQHAQTFEDRLGQFGIKIKSLSRFSSPGDQKKAIEGVASGGVDIIIGTHRLLSQDVKFKNLMLTVIDEEQKFGVKHKEKLKKMRSGVDILTMTATPIPRTLYLGLGGLRDISLITTPPEGRLPIKTVVAKYDDEVIKSAIVDEVKRGGQIYFVHNRVETISGLYAHLKKMLPKIKIAIGHGQMPEKELARVMNDFAAGKHDILLCSTIIESGLDISTVNTLIVDRATHLGLSQLHQLRGRIGRGDKQAHAYFLYREQDLVGDAKRRLKSIAEKGELGSGYELSLEDLDIRGSGNILGREQHGSMMLVGVGYYMRLLEEAVERAKSGKNKVDIGAEIKIDLPVSALVPDGFYEKEEDKIRAYQTLAESVDETEIDDFQSEISQDTSELPEEYSNLLELIRLKIRARKSGVLSMVAQDILDISGMKKKKLIIDFDHILEKREVDALALTIHGWDFGNTNAKIDLKKLGDDWMQRLLVLFQRLEK